MNENRVLVVTGMHRSGTSLVARLVRGAGVTIERSGDSPAGIPNPDPIDSAEAFIAERRGSDLWGFEAPRASLCLASWRRLLPAARYLLIYRHPVDVVLSLMRRGAEAEVMVDPVLGLSAWDRTNQSLLDFYRRHPGDCLLCDIHGVLEDVDGFLEVVQKLLGMSLQTRGSRRRGWPRAPGRSPSVADSDRLLGQIAPETRRILAGLNAEADMPCRDLQETAAGDSAPAALQTAAERVMADGALRDRAPGPLLALHLAMVDPRWASSKRSRQSLSELLSATENLRLAREVAGLEARLETLEAEIDDRARRFRRQEEQLRSQEDRLWDLQAELAERTRWACGIDLRAEGRKAGILELQAEFEEQLSRRLRLKIGLLRRERRICELEAELGGPGSPGGAAAGEPFNE